MPGRTIVFLGLLALLAALGPGAAPPASDAPAAPTVRGPSPPRVENSDVRFTIGEASLLECLRAATPYVLTVGAQPVGLDLVFLDPGDLHLKDGRASFKIRIKARNLPIDQVVSPVVSLTFDKDVNKYFAVLSSLPLQVPGLPAIDLKDYAPRIEVPQVVENAWRFADRPIGLNLKIRQIAIVEHALEVGAQLSVDSPVPGTSRSAR